MVTKENISLIRKEWKKNLRGVKGAAAYVAAQAGCSKQVVVTAMGRKGYKKLTVLEIKVLDNAEDLLKLWEESDRNTKLMLAEQYDNKL